MQVGGLEDLAQSLGSSKAASKTLNSEEIGARLGILCYADDRSDHSITKGYITVSTENPKRARRSHAETPCKVGVHPPETQC